MNLVRALVLMIVGIAGLAYLWGGLETLSLADDPACHGPDGAFVRVVDANGDLRDVKPELKAGAWQWMPKRVWQTPLGKRST